MTARTTTPRPPRPSVRAASAAASLSSAGSASVAAPEEPDTILHHALVEAARLLRADGAIAYLLDPTTGVLQFADDAGITNRRRQQWVRTLRVEPGVGLFGLAVGERRIALTDDYPNDPGFPHFEGADRLVRSLGIRSFLVAPMIAGDRVFGAMGTYSSRVASFSEHDEALVKALADHAAIAMANAELIVELDRSRRDVERRAEGERALREIAARITAIRDPADLLQDVVDAAARLLQAERVRIDLVGEAGGRIGWAHLGAGRHIGGAAVDEAGEAFTYGASGRAIAERRTVVVDDYPNDASFEHDPTLDAAVQADGICSLVVTPMIAEESLLGVLQVGSSHTEAFGPEQVALAEALAHQAAIAIRNSRLVAALERSAEEIQRRARAEQELREIATTITAIRDPEELLQQVTDAARRLLAAQRSQLDIVEPRTGLIRWTVASGEGQFGVDLPGTQEGVAAEVGINAAAIAAGQVVVTGEYLKDERVMHLPESDRYVRKVGIKSVIAVPLLSEEQLLGILKVATTRRNAFDDEDAALMAAFADQVVVAIQNARLIDELRRSREEVSRRADAERSVREIAANISALRDTDAILQQTVDEARRLLHSTSARIDMLDDDGVTMRWAYASGEDAVRTRMEGFDAEFRLGEGIAGRTVATGEAFRTDDYLSDDRFQHVGRSDALVRATGFRSVLAAPLRGESGSLGAISVSSTETHHYDENQAELLQGLADQAAIAIQNARLIEELDRSSIELARRADAEQSLRQIAAQITAIRDPGSLLQQVVDAAKRLVGADGSVLDLVDPDGSTLRWSFDAGISGSFTPDEIATMTIPVGIGATGEAVAQNRVILESVDPKGLFPDSEVNDLFFDRTGFRSMIIAPVSGESGPLGALEVYSRTSNAFDEDDAGVIRSLAAQAAIAITNARLIEELNRSRRHIVRRAEAERSLREIAARITAIRDTGELLQHVADEAARLLGSEGAIIDLLDPISGTLSMGYVAGLDADRAARWATSRVGEDIVRRALTDRAPLYTTDYLGDPRFSLDAHASSMASEIGLRAIAIAPLVSERGSLGTLAVFSSSPGTFGSDEADLLGALADQAAIAMLNARLIDELERSQKELATRAETERSLRDIAARITSLGDPGEILARVVEESRRLLRSDGAHLTRMSDDGTYLVPVIVAGGMDATTEEWLKRMEFPLGGGINGLAAEEVQPVWTYDYETDPRIPHEPDDDRAAERLGLRGMAAAPLRAPAGEVIGTLAVSYREPRDILPDDLDLLQGLADQAAIALTNANLYELLGRHFGALVHESSRDVAEIDWTVGIGGDREAGDGDAGRELRGRVNLLHRDGHPIPAEFIAFAAVDETGRFIGANGSVRDMSEQTRLERELRESEERYRFLVENSPDIVFSTDAEGIFTFLSETIEAVTGFAPSELVGGHFSRLVDIASHPVAIERWTRLVAEPSVRQVVKLDLVKKGGGTVPVEVSSIGTTVNGVFAGIHGATRDITERERLERDLRRQAGELASSQERAHLARELHDSVTQALFSMTLITRSTELVVDRDPAAAREKLASLRELQREALAEMRALIFELRPGNLEADGLLPALRTLAGALQGRIGLPIVVTSELTERLPLALEEVLYRIAQEALHNVVKHAAARQVDLGVDRRGPMVVLRIRDDGKGFDADAVPDGHLGLAGMRARADKIGARFAVLSRPGEGTTIEVGVPAEVVERAAAESRPPANAALATIRGSAE